MSETPSKKRRFAVTLLKLGFALALWGGVTLFAVALYFLRDVPEIPDDDGSMRYMALRFLDNNGKEISYRSNNIGQGVDVYALPPYFIDALLATEDRRFFEHGGADMFGILRAAISNFRAGRVVQGGSTITQQLAKLMFLSPERTLKRKIQEVYIAFQLESRLTKEEILSRYLSRVYFGSGNYGLKAAAKDYFAKDYAKLTLFESAMLVGAIKAPSVYNPFADAKRSEERAMQVIYNMIDHGSLDASALSAPDFALYWTDKKSVKEVETGYFLDWANGHASDYIGADAYGEYTVRTTLDMKAQHIAQQVCAGYAKDVNASHPGTDAQCAVIIMTPDGAVLAMTGGRSYAENGYNRAVSAMRQPGSLFKTVVYAAAMEQGMSPYDIMTDKPLSYGSWSPKNWNDRHIGDVSLKTAFAQSINSVAVQLTDMIGARNVIKTARDMGISADLDPHLSIALGSEEIPLLDMTAAFAHIPNKGASVWTHGIVSVTGENGNALYSRDNAPKTRALSAASAQHMTALTRAVVTSGTGKKAAVAGAAVAGKTGTTQDLRDAWFIGFTPDIVAGVWLGKDDNTPMHKDIGGGGNIPARMFADIVARYYRDTGKALPPASLYDGAPVRNTYSPAPVAPAQRYAPPPARSDEGGFFRKLRDLLERN